MVIGTNACYMYLECLCLSIQSKCRNCCNKTQNRKESMTEKCINILHNNDGIVFSIPFISTVLPIMIQD